MAIRIPTQTVLSAVNANELGAGSVAGGIAHPFQIPQDTDNVVVKFICSVAGTGMSAVFQTSDDGGTTYYDVARTSIVSNGALPEFLSVPVISAGVNPQVISTVNAGSVLGGSIGNAAASSLGQRQVSGLPILGVQNRIFVRINGNVTSATSNSYTAQVKVNSQSATA